MKISSKAIVSMILVLMIVMGLIFMMSYFKFQTTLEALIQNRLSVISITMGESIESAIDLGLGLGEMRTAEEVIARAKRNDPGIASIQIFDSNGQILYSTQKEMAGTNVPPYVLQALQESDDQAWWLDRGNYFVNGVSLLNSFDQMIGGIVLKYPKDAYNTKVAALTHSLTRKSILIFVGFAILAFIGIKLGFRGLSRYAESIESSYQRIQEEGDAVCTIDLSGLPAAASAESMIRMDDLDEKLCKIRDNLSEATKDMHELEGAALKISAGAAQPEV
ncbi:MAG: hypothetical protein AMJ56_18540 [Anaerolineae bacterium SG8_19]|nr:MAG: hypothetical protein AMJ56_18540 [Anaerolineae bacterium SG8_19]